MQVAKDAGDSVAVGRRDSGHGTACSSPITTLSVSAAHGVFTDRCAVLVATILSPNGPIRHSCLCNGPCGLISEVYRKNGEAPIYKNASRITVFLFGGSKGLPSFRRQGGQSETNANAIGRAIAASGQIMALASGQMAITRDVAISKVAVRVMRAVETLPAVSAAITARCIETA